MVVKAVSESVERPSPAVGYSFKVFGDFVPARHSGSSRSKTAGGRDEVWLAASSQQEAELWLTTLRDGVSPSLAMKPVGRSASAMAAIDAVREELR
jgi:cytidylate kinase